MNMKELTVKIESNIPIPADKTAYSHYPFGSMKTFQSFVFESGPAMGDINALRQAAAHYAKRTRKKFKTKKIGPGSWRVWRIE